MTDELRAELRQTVAQLGQLADRRDELIRECIAAGVRVKDLVADTGLTRGRIYQIRDEGAAQ
jgi:uncharacterized coiled-coil DUF342 family protein